MAKKRIREPDTIESIADEFMRIIISPLRDTKLCWCVPCGETLSRGDCALCKTLAAYEQLRPGRIASIKNEYGLGDEFYPQVTRVGKE